MTKPARRAKDTQKLQAGSASEDDIRPTDILFNCPHCGHSLCIDCRGAGLLTHCTECSEEVLVPIPDGMTVDDLDLTSEQAMGQLLYTRRMLTRAEQRIVELEDVVSSLKERRSAMEKARLTTLHHCADIANLCQVIQERQGEIATALNRMLEVVAREQQH